MAQKDRKTNRLRGSRTHGYGNAQKHRGAGSRGGRGMAGSKKSKWMQVSKNVKGYLGYSGFKRPAAVKSEPKIINVGDLSKRIRAWLVKGLAEDKQKKYVVDLAKPGFDKLLGSGSVSEPFEVTVDYCTEKARAKIEAAGGKVNVNNSQQDVAGEEVTDGEAGLPETDA